jgi:hypothetical protein
VSRTLTTWIPQRPVQRWLAERGLPLTVETLADE